MYVYKPAKLLQLLPLLLCTCCLQAQTDLDADMMAKGLLCTGPMYSYNTWNHYWEGTRKRDNLNVGNLSTQTLSFMGDYGISKKLNVLLTIPYVQTKAAAGTLHGLKGFQDASIFLKWMPVKRNIGQGRLSLAGVAGYMFPLSDYTSDFQPLSIGTHSRSLLGRVIADYQWNRFFATISGTYMYRNNITLSRNVYYTTELHYSNKVAMPNVASFNFRTGYRSKRFVAEATANNWTTLGGFDITRNNTPFPSNRTNITMAGFNVRWMPRPLRYLTINTGADYTLAGRNAGQAATVYGGLYYIFNFNRKTPVTL